MHEGRTFQREHKVVERVGVLLVRLSIVLLVILLDGEPDKRDSPLWSNNEFGHSCSEYADVHRGLRTLSRTAVQKQLGVAAQDTQPAGVRHVYGVRVS